MLVYLYHPMDRPGHHPLAKRLFKHAEEQADDELMAAFMVAFDRLVRRQRRTRWRYDYNTRQGWQEEFLSTPRNRIPTKLPPTYYDRRTGEPIAQTRPQDRLFSYHTRYYLRRRAWRYFRRMGFQRPADYPAAVAAALRRYTDDDFAKGENILDSWSLCQACYHGHEALQFTASKVALRPGKSLADLSPAPRFPKLWQKPESTKVLLTLLAEALSRLVRLWAMAMLREHHADKLAGLEPTELIALLDHPDGEVQQFAAELLKSAAGLESLGLDVWLRLLEVDNPVALAAICDAMKTHVAPDRLSLDQCLDLACSTPAPAAKLGLGFLRQRPLASSPGCFDAEAEHFPPPLAGAYSHETPGSGTLLGEEPKS